MVSTRIMVHVLIRGLGILVLGDGVLGQEPAETSNAESSVSWCFLVFIRRLCISIIGMIAMNNHDHSHYNHHAHHNQYASTCKDRNHMNSYWPNRQLVCWLLMCGMAWWLHWIMLPDAAWFVEDLQSITGILIGHYSSIVASGLPRWCWYWLEDLPGISQPSQKAWMVSLKSTAGWFQIFNWLACSWQATLQTLSSMLVDQYSYLVGGMHLQPKTSNYWLLLASHMTNSYTNHRQTLQPV